MVARPALFRPISALAVMALVAALALAGGPASAAGIAVTKGAAAPPTESPAGGPSTVVLANTGLDIAAPIAVGLAILLLGTALVAWAVLRGSRGSHGGPTG